MTPRFTIISPLYNVGRYLDHFFASIEAQTFDLDDIEVILVDDGSTDDSLDRARRFAESHPGMVTVMTQENGGQGAARNSGLELATGEWITFPDPDDAWTPDYLTRVSAYLDSPGGEEADMLSARLMMWNEARDVIRPDHVLDFRFREGSRTVNLAHDPRIIQTHVNAGFFRRSVVEEHGLRFRTELRLRFEDGNFVTRYLLTRHEPLVGIVADAEYNYRQRADNSSTVQASSASPEKYVDTIRDGYLDVIRVAEEIGRPLPAWAQNLMIYDQFWIFRSSQTPAVRHANFPEWMHTELAWLYPAWLKSMDESYIIAFDLMPVAHWMRDAMLLLKQGAGHSAVFTGGTDRHRGMIPIIYRYIGKRPIEELLIGGVPASARFDNEQDLELLGRPIVTNRVLWVTTDATVELYLDGVRQRMNLQEVPHTTFTLQRSAFRKQPGIAQTAAPRAPLPSWFGPLRRPLTVAHRKLRTMQRVGFTTGAKAMIDRVRTRRAIASRRLRALYKDAWVFIDRDVDANDSAEVLYRWVTGHHPEVPAWFVIRKNTTDWDRLRREGFNLVAYGSPEFHALMLNAAHLASSHADRFITDAVPVRYGRPRYSFTFLQHGVIKGDISRWLNSKSISTFVVSTEAEYDYVAGPGPFKFSQREVRLSGLPRFDDLLERDQATADSDRRLILIMPTWRDHLVGPMGATSDARERAADFAETEYARAITGLLFDEGLRSAAAEHGMKIIFMPHPIMAGHLPQFSVPAHVTTIGYGDANVRDLIARARVMITDYSSIAFNMGFVHRPVVYFQFDADDYYLRHTERPGYFDYESHGFGPVTSTVDETVDAVRAVLSDELDPMYARRAAETFPIRDGQNSRRVYEAIVASRTPAPFAKAITPSPPERWSSLVD